MLLDGIRHRVRERLIDLEMGAKSVELIKELKRRGIGETFVYSLAREKDGYSPSDPGVSMLEELAEVLDCSVTWLIVGIGPKSAKYGAPPSTDVIAFKEERLARQPGAAKRKKAPSKISR